MAEPMWDGKKVRIVSRHSGLVLTAPDDWSGTWVVQFTDNSTKRQRWRLVRADEEDGSYTIKNEHNHKVLEVLAGSLDDGAAIDLWEENAGRHQQWRLKEAGTDSDVFFYQISNVKTGKCLDVNGGSSSASLADHARIAQWEYVEGENQQWFIEVCE